MLHRATFWTIRAEEAAGASELFHLTGSKGEEIDVVMTWFDSDRTMHSRVARPGKNGV